MPIKKRKVFYISGFDPRPPYLYYKIFKKNMVLQNNINNLNNKITSSNFKINNPFFILENNTTETTYQFLNWSDIIKKEWPKTRFDMIKEITFSIKEYIFKNNIKNFIKRTPKQLIGGFYPLFFIILSTFFSFIISNNLIGLFTNNVLILSFCSILIFMILLEFGRKIGIFWLSSIFNFYPKWKENKIKYLNERLTIFKNLILKEIQNEDFDEVLVVSHSVGTSLIIPIVNSLIDELDKTELNKINILTLGNCTPLMSLQKNNQEYNNQLKRILTTEDIYWRDFTSPIDGAAFPKFNFIKGIKIKNKKFLSPRFHKLFFKKNYLKIRYNWYKVHFLYLMATDKKGDFDFFEIVSSYKEFKDY